MLQRHISPWAAEVAMRMTKQSRWWRVACVYHVLIRGIRDFQHPTAAASTATATTTAAAAITSHLGCTPTYSNTYQDPCLS